MTTISYPIPKNEDDFESLCLDLFRVSLSSRDFQRNGRRGQRQNGVDIFGYDSGGCLNGVQCKLHEPPHELTEKEVRKEVEKAKGFEPPLGHFIIATTSKRDPELQRVALRITRTHQNQDLFSVQISGWDDLSELLQSNPAVAERLISPAILATQLHQRRQIDRLLALHEGRQQTDGDHADIDNAVSYRRTAPLAAQTLLQQIRIRKWDRLDARARYRVLANLGLVAYDLEKTEEAGRLLVEARTYQPDDDDQVQALEALGYFYLGQPRRAFEIASGTLRAHPMQALAASVLIRSAADTAQLEEVVRLIPEALRLEPDVAVALSLRARLAGNFEAALAFIAPAVDREPKLESVIEELSRATLGAMSKGVGVASGLPRRTETPVLLDLLGRIGECLGALRSDAVASQARILFLRAVVNARLGHLPASRGDAARAYALDPSNEDAVTQYALDEQEQGRPDQAIAALRRSTSSSNRVLLARCLRQAGEEKGRMEALSTLRGMQAAIANEDGWVRRVWANELVLLFIECGEPDEGLAMLEILPQAILEDYSKSSLKAMLFRAKGDRDSEVVAVKDAFRLVSSATAWDERRRVALQLQALGLYEEAFEIWQRLIAPTSLRDDVRNYLFCANRVQRDSHVLDFCKSARAEGYWMPDLVGTELLLLEKYNSRSEALKLAREFVQTCPGDEASSEVRAQVALVAIRSGDPSVASDLLEGLPSPKKAIPRVGRAVVEVLRRLGQLSEAATYAYDLVRVNPQSIDAHKAVLASFGLGGIGPEIAIPTRAEVGVAARYQAEDTGQEAWCVIERELGRGTDGEMFGPEHPLAVELIGKAVGASFVLRKTALQERRGTILELVDKRVWRLRNSMETWEQRFPEDFSIQEFILPHEGDIETRLAPVFRAVDLRAESQEEAFRQYRNGRMPLHVLSEALGGTLFEAALGAAAHPELPVPCCLGSDEERSLSSGVILGAKAMVVDPTCLATLFLSDTADVLAKVKVPLVVSQGSLDDLRRGEVLSHTEGTSIRRLGRVNGRYRIAEVLPDEASAMRTRLERFIAIVERDCEVVSGLALAAVDARKREQMISLIGRASAESAAIAVGCGGVLWTDDLLVAVVAGELLQCGRVWSQLVFEEEAKAGGVSPELYGRLVLGLFEAQYVYTWLNPVLLMSCGQSCRWDFRNVAFQRVLEHFADQNVNASGLGVLTLKTLRVLWAGDVLDEVAQATTIRIAANILKRSDGRALLEAVRKNIRTAFGLNVLGELKVGGILAALRDLPLG